MVRTAHLFGQRTTQQPPLPPVLWEFISDKVMGVSVAGGGAPAQIIKLTPRYMEPEL